ncbi:E3 ISG15--protein ligase Herc6 [Durusdinium trenchii]|uniref:E3 ISG15--protein ligase Herc6 n=1 Tax=Durusdinium trenchii TaxID=1381693 RepID=A0ABP0MDE7_9DINO
MNSVGQCKIPPLKEGMSYNQVAAGCFHTVLLRSDGDVVACGSNSDGQCDIPPLEEGISYTQVSAGGSHTVLLRSDGNAVACGSNSDGQCDIPALEKGISYTQVSAGCFHTVLLRSDGNAVACGSNSDGQCDIPALEKGISYTQVSAGCFHTVLLRLDGHAAGCGSIVAGWCDIPPLEEGMFYTQLSAGGEHTVLLRSDGNAVACGRTSIGQCDIPPLQAGLSYTWVSAVWNHTVLLRSDGSAVACGDNEEGQCNIPPLEPGNHYISPFGRDLVFQLNWVCEDDEIMLTCSDLAPMRRRTGLDPPKGRKFVRCKRADEEMIGLYCKDPAGLYLLAFSSSSSRVAEHLLEEGHGVRPSTEVTGEPAPTTLAAAGLSSLSDLHWSKGSIHLIETCAGLWVEEELHLDGGEESKPETSALRLARRIRLISRRGLLAEVHFAEPYRAVAGCLALEPATDADQVGDKVCVCRKIAVDTEPGRVATRHLSEVSKDQMLDLPDGDVPGFTWRRISQDEMPVAAAELLMEQAAGPGSKPPVCGLRAGVWIVCGDVSLQVLGPPRGEGFIGATLCMSMEQLKRIQEPQTLEEELQGRYEASTGLIVEKGCIRRDRGVGRAAEAKGPLLCGAGVNNNDPGFKTVSILYSTGLMTKGGSITLDSGTFNQVWRIRELEDNPFDSPSLRAARKVPAVGRAAGPASAVARVASSFSPKGKGKGKGKSGKGRGSRAPVSAAPARQAVPAFRPPLGSWPATRSLTVYGALPSPVVRGGALSFAPRPRLGSRPPGRPLSSLQAELHAPGRPGPPRREPAPRREPEPVRRGVTLSSGPGHRRRSRSVSRRKELRSPGYRDAPKTHGTPKFDRHRSRSNRGKRSRSRSRGGRRGARKN